MQRRLEEVISRDPSAESQESFAEATRGPPGYSSVAAKNRVDRRSRLNVPRRLPYGSERSD